MVVSENWEILVFFKFLGIFRNSEKIELNGLLSDLVILTVRMDSIMVHLYTVRIGQAPWTISN